MGGWKGDCIQRKGKETRQAQASGSFWKAQRIQGSCGVGILLSDLSAPQSALLPTSAAAKSLQSCLTLCDPIDGSPPGSPVPGILQARTLEWVAISFSNA